MNIWAAIVGSGLLTTAVASGVAWLINRSTTKTTLKVAEANANATLKAKEDELAAGAWSRTEVIYQGGLAEATRQIGLLTARVSEQDRHIGEQDNALVGCRRRISALEVDLAVERRGRRKAERDLATCTTALALVHPDEADDATT